MVERPGTIADIIRAIREAAGLTRYEFAIKLRLMKSGVDKLASWEDSRRVQRPGLEGIVGPLAHEAHLCRRPDLLWELLAYYGITREHIAAWFEPAKAGGAPASGGDPKQLEARVAPKYRKSR